jgi:hypothetical protein
LPIRSSGSICWPHEHVCAWLAAIMRRRPATIA